MARPDESARVAWDLVGGTALPDEVREVAEAFGRLAENADSLNDQAFGGQGG